MDFLNTIKDFFTKGKFGFLSDLFSSLTSPFESIFSTISEIGKKTGHEDATSGFTGLLAQFKQWFSSTILGKVDHDAVLAQQTIAANLDLAKVFTPVATSAGLDETTAKDLQEMAKGGATDFLKEGIPSLDQYGKPTASLSAAIDLHDKIVKYLAGEGNNMGQLAANNLSMPPAERKQKAEAIASYITGLPPQPEGGYDLPSLLINLPKSGLAGMFLAAQTKTKAQGYVKDGLTADDLALTLNMAELKTALATPAAGNSANALADARKATAQTKKDIAGGDHVNAPVAPLGGKLNSPAAAQGMS